VQFKNPVDGTMWWKRYKEWYPGNFRGWDIARDALAGGTSGSGTSTNADGGSTSTDIEKGVDSWWQAVAYNSAYPEWLRCAALNELYYDVFGGVFWEDGCITKPKIYGNRPGQHLYFSMESDSLRDCESMDVRHYEDIHMIQLFPEIERDLLLGWADIILSDQQHITPHDAGSPVNDPWFIYDQYGDTVRGGQPMNVDWLDLPSKYVLQSYVYWTYTGDDSFVKEVYPACKATMEHMLSLDFDGDGIPDADGSCSTYDNVPFYGANIYIAVLEIGALEAMASIARFVHDTEGEKRWKAALLLARGTAEHKLWDPSLGYFKMNSEGENSDALMSDGMCGQMHVQAGGLPDALPLDKIASHLSRVYQMAVLPYEQGSMGAVNMVQSNGKPLDISDESYGVWPGASYFTAALMYRAGKRSSSRHLKREALEMGHGLYSATYENDETAFWFSTPAVWVPASPLHWRTPTYMRNRAVWELLLAVQDPFEQ
jgi:non-lysosomal glucosylceramidase